MTQLITPFGPPTWCYPVNYINKERDIDKSNLTIGSWFIGLVIFLLAGAGIPAHAQESSLVGQAALEYLKDLKGKWVVQGGDKGEFGWEFDVTSRGSVVTERLKVGTPTEMTTTSMRNITVSCKTDPT
jgi:hypothetical protein